MDNTLNILSIDDDPVILNSIFSVLASDYNVFPFTDGKAAFDFLAKKNADLILLDIHMPGINGIEILQRIRESETTKDVPVIFLTGDTDETGETGALTSGANDYIGKPVRPEVLRTRVKIQIDLFRHRKRLEELVLEKTKKISAREDIILNMLARVTDIRDPDTGGHILRTTEYTKIIADEIAQNPFDEWKLTRLEADDIVKSAKLHDFGKISVPDAVLLKPSRLTAAEFEIIKKHTIVGYELLEEFSKTAEADTFWNVAKDIAKYHHEKWNGKGYPEGLSGLDIPLSARIVALADVYDALTSKRVYKDVMSFAQAEEIISNDRGEHFDPRIVDIFFKHIQKFQEVAKTIV